MHRNPLSARLPVAFAAVSALVLVLLFQLARPAEGHGAEGTMSVLSATAAGGTVALEVGVLYANDQEPAEEAEVTATLTGPGGTTIGPVALTQAAEGSGRYTASVPVPSSGSWTVTFAATEPAAAATAIVEVAQAGGAGTTASTGATPSSGAAGSSTTAKSPGSTAAGGSGSVTPSTAAPAPAATENTTNTLVAGGIIGVLVVVVLAFVARRRAGSGTDSAGA